MSARQTVDHLLKGLGRRYPLVRGHGWIAHHVLPRPDVAPGTSSEVTLRSGERIHVDPADYIGRIIQFFGDLDPRISWICRRLLRPGDTVVDVGANVGVLTLLSAGLVGPTGTVHAFEPQPAVADLLRRSVEENGYAHVHLHQMALSDTDTSATSMFPRDTSAAHRPRARAPVPPMCGSPSGELTPSWKISAWARSGCSSSTSRDTSLSSSAVPSGGSEPIRPTPSSSS